MRKRGQNDCTLPAYFPRRITRFFSGTPDPRTGSLVAGRYVDIGICLNALKLAPPPRDAWLHISSHIHEQQQDQETSRVARGPSPNGNAQNVRFAETVWARY